MRKDGLTPEWFLRFKSGDQLAFNELQQLYSPKLHYFITQKGVPVQFAEDLVQETFYIVWIRHPVYKDINHVVRSLYYVAGIRVKVFKRKNLPTFEFDPEKVGDFLQQPEVQATLHLADVLEELNSRLKDLTPSQQRVLKCLLDGNSIQETAKLLGMTPNQVSVTKSDALKRLKLKRPDDDKNIFPFS